VVLDVYVSITAFQSNTNAEDKHCKIGEKTIKHSTRGLYADLSMIPILGFVTVPHRISHSRRGRAASISPGTFLYPWLKDCHHAIGALPIGIQDDYKHKT
jgi:hypothetical protein